MRNKSKPEKGLVAICKLCCREIAEYNWKANPEKYREANLMSYHKNNEARNSYHRDWRLNNIEHCREYGREYEHNNPEKFKQYNENRRHKNHRVTKQEWLACKNYFDNSCAYCGMAIEEHYNLNGQDLHKEHVVHEGSIELDNCVPSCKSCNSSKWKHSMEEWYRSREYFDEDKLTRINKWTSDDYLKYYEPEKPPKGKYKWSGKYKKSNN